MTAECQEYQEAVSAHMDGEGPEPGSALLAHAGSCDECRGYWAGAQRVEASATSLVADPGPDLTERLVGALTAAGRPRPGLLSGRRGVAGAAVAAAVLAAVLVGGTTAFAHRHTSSGSGGSGASAGAGPNGAGARVQQVAGSDDRNPNYPGLVQSPRPYPEPDVSLTDTSGQPFDLKAAAAGRITLVYFGYTHCPDVCPINMALNAAALADLPSSVASKVQVVFVTTDPDRDTPAVIRAWLDHFNTSFIGLTGSITQIHAAESQVGMPLSYVESAGPGAAAGSYDVVHAGYTLVFTPDGLAHLFYEDNASPSAVASALVKLSEHGYRSA